jgi:hypothetical protein
VFVVIPGPNRGIRFVRACTVYLASCFRRALIKAKAQCPHLDVFHTLDDDWQNPRVFDPALIGEQCMRPCSLYMALRYAQEVMRTELSKNDSRDALLRTDSRPAGWMELLNEAWRAASDQDDFNLRDLLRRQSVSIRKAADEGQLHSCLRPYAAAYAPALPRAPSFEKRFLQALEKSKGSGQVVAQVGLTHKNITALINYNNARVGKGANGLVTHPHYRVSADRHGCITHYLPIYEREQVNFLNDADFFLPQEQISARLRLEHFTDWFRSDRHFIREVLEPRGIGGVLLFKFDIDFARVRLGGLMAIPTARRAQPAQRDDLLQVKGEDSGRDNKEESEEAGKDDHGRESDTGNDEDGDDRKKNPKLAAKSKRRSQAAAGTTKSGSGRKKGTKRRRSEGSSPRKVESKRR